MPTNTKNQAISLDEALDRAGRRAFANAGAPGRLGRIGLEQELFAIAVDRLGRPTGRVPLEGRHGVFESLDQLAMRNGTLHRHPGPATAPREYRLRNGGRLTFEPGGQIEHSTVVHDSATAALEDVSGFQDYLSRALNREGKVLAAAGTDLWHPVKDIPLQLHGGRYQAMSDYFDLRGPWGRVMMRHSASLQLNLDFGPEGVWQERWLLSNLIAPLILATFAASPGRDSSSERALAWQHLDPTRTGFPAKLVSGKGDGPMDEWASAALDADVLLFRRDGTDWEPGRVGWTVRDWIEQGHPELGWPTVDDFDYHLTTLFLEVRPRGFLELRSCESLPDRWRAAPVVLVSALLYDDRARGMALALLEGLRSELPELWRRAAREGLHDAQLASLAARLWEIALAGVDRLPIDYFGAEAVATVREFLGRYTFAGRTPADRLAELVEDPRRALAWAAGCRERCQSVEDVAASQPLEKLNGKPALTCVCCNA